MNGAAPTLSDALPTARLVQTGTEGTILPPPPNGVSPNETKISFLPIISWSDLRQVLGGRPNRKNSFLSYEEIISALINLNKGLVLTEVDPLWAGCGIRSLLSVLAPRAGSTWGVAIFIFI